MLYSSLVTLTNPCPTLMDFNLVKCLKLCKLWLDFFCLKNYYSATWCLICFFFVVIRDNFSYVWLVFCLFISYCCFFPVFNGMTFWCLHGNVNFTNILTFLTVSHSLKYSIITWEVLHDHEEVLYGHKTIIWIFKFTSSSCQKLYEILS